MSALSRIFRTEHYVLPIVNGTNVANEDKAKSSRVIKLTGTLTAAATLILPEASGLDWVVWNATNIDVSLKLPASSAVIVPAGKTGLVACSGVDLQQLVTPPTGQIPYGQAWTSADTFSFYTASGGPPLTNPFLTLSELGISWGRFSAAAYGHDTVVGDFATTNTVFTSQAPWASATGTNRNSAGLEWVIPSPAAGGTAGTYGWKISGTTRATMSTTTFALGALNVTTTGYVEASSLSAKGVGAGNAGYLYLSDNDDSVAHESYVAEVDTTDATVTTIALIPSNFGTVLSTHHATFTAFKSDGTSGFAVSKTATFRQNGAGACTQIGTTVADMAAVGDACDATIDTLSGEIRFRVTGIAATTYRWSVTIKSSYRTTTASDA